MSKLKNIRIHYAPLSKSIVLARFGKDPNIALETKDVLGQFLIALVFYAFSGKPPETGESRGFKFGNDDEQFSVVVTSIEGKKADD